MPDRAVVDDEYCGYPSGNCLIHQARPRAVVAISPDRQWLVVLEPIDPLIDDADYTTFMVHKYIPRGNASWWRYASIPDTGQSADAVLDAFLKHRGS